MFSIPLDCINEICKYLKLKDLLIFKQCNKEFYYKPTRDLIIKKKIKYLIRIFIKSNNEINRCERMMILHSKNVKEDKYYIRNSNKRLGTDSMIVHNWTKLANAEYHEILFRNENIREYALYNLGFDVKIYGSDKKCNYLQKKVFNKLYKNIIKQIK